MDRNSLSSSRGQHRHGNQVLHKNLAKWAFYAAFCKQRFGLEQHATITFAPNGHNCGFAVEMTPRETVEKSYPPDFSPFPPRLEIPQTTRDSHIPPATTTAGLLSPQNRTPKPQKSNPSKIEGPVSFSRRAGNHAFREKPYSPTCKDHLVLGHSLANPRPCSFPA